MRARASLLVIYSTRAEECRDFYEELGLGFREERHGGGHEHVAAELPGGLVLEIYPATAERATGFLRIGFDLDGDASPGLPRGRHVLVDPDGRKVEVNVR
ncbi:glyoxalase/bleomycin resistance/dioxygenase family protein [Sphaerisporangium album]|uniref:Glyoxalase/bleomycin resistance/dioxygenase family protein n=2 Tax=Sphaerisporangium album TaxID=509200 RepID=A0A367ETS2_9ACTN|nr:glyoxalase/bleomycin resistance/dioxygenase family protein [Sphaerisporangium album]